MDRTIKRGDIFYAELNPVIGSEQGGTRPVLIISNDIGNRHSPTVIIAAITIAKNLEKGFAYRMIQFDRPLRRPPSVVETAPRAARFHSLDIALTTAPPAPAPGCA